MIKNKCLRAKYMRKYYLKNREKKKKYDKIYHKKNKIRIKTKKHEYYMKNRSKISKRNKKYYLKNYKVIKIRKRKSYIRNRENILKRCKKYRKKNAEKIKKTVKKWQKRNPEKVRRYKKKWHDMNIELCKEYTRTHRKQAINRARERCKKYQKTGKTKCIDCGKNLGSYTRKRCQVCRIKQSLKLHQKKNKSEIFIDNILQRILPNEYKYVGQGDVLIERYNPDFININSKKKIIEFFGNFWHTTRPRCIEKDRKKRRVYKKYGYDCLVIRTKDLKSKNLESKILKFNNRILKFQVHKI